ncbi:Amuc_1100 family pilus-like protein [Luteolibacter marinus]|uniref:Amuc_1100 family pilus-like protein n=1 Tax=Luteolibacter marinus TaxID=2776705 RepID=UPI001868C74B|nr:Amuc_1100 family pilus-like protein [Luteolibacter marinus]
MSWIQENRFAAGLGGITAVAAAGLIAWGVSAGKKYNTAKEEYEAASGEVDSMESARLYPSEENLSGKVKAVKEYTKEVGELEEAFVPFRTATPPNVDPDQFTEALLKAKEVAAAAFEKAGTELPAEFFLGSEVYTTSPVKKEATGILTYQLEAISQLAANLADAAPDKLLNIHRPLLAEEEGGKFEPAKGQLHRALPVEISFNGTEASLRKFLSSLDDSGKFYYVIRSMRVMNEKTKAPTASDGVFQSDEPEGGAEAADPFGGAGGFVLPGEEPAEDAAAETPDAEAPAEEAPPADEGNILQQVLGSEKINVFLRIDILQFLEANKA